MKTLTKQIEAKADIVRIVETPQDHGLKNLAGRIAEINLRIHGWDSYTMAETGQKVIIKLKSV